MVCANTHRDPLEGVDGDQDVADQGVDLVGGEAAARVLEHRRLREEPVRGKCREGSAEERRCGLWTSAGAPTRTQAPVLSLAEEKRWGRVWPP